MGSLPNHHWLDTIGRALWGGDEIKEALVLTAKKQSKGLPLDAEIITPCGFKTMQELQVGDTVYAADGSLTTVIDKSEILDRPCYEVEFSCGAKVVCSDDHRWFTDAHLDRQNARGAGRLSEAKAAPSFKTTRELAESVDAYVHPAGKYVIRNHRVAVAGPMRGPDVPLPVDPYVLGVWLGDGAASGPTLTISTLDRDGIEQGLTAAYPNLSWAAASRGAACWQVRIKADPGASHNRFLADLKAAGVLNSKHIPPAYLRASYSQRLALLQGLCDTDGWVQRGSSKSRSVKFGQSDKALAQQVFELACTLGFKPSFAERPAKIGDVEYSPAYHVQFHAVQEDAPFRSKRKLAALGKRADVNAERSKYRQIVAVREVPAVPTQCIRVDHPSEQFLITRSAIPTGNTSGGAMLCLSAFLAFETPNMGYTLIAPTLSIANFAFEQIAGSLRADPELELLVKIVDYKKEIVHRINGAKLMVRPASLSAITGLKGSVFLDELWVFGGITRGQKLRQQLRGALAANPMARGLYITTQSDHPPQGLFRTMLSYARKVRDGEIHDPSFLPVLFEPWPGCDPWLDSTVWPCLLPSYPHIAGPEFYRGVINEAIVGGPSMIAEAKSQMFNVEISSGMSGAAWIAARIPPSLRDPEIDLNWIIENCDRIAVGIDLGGSVDLTALTVVGELNKVYHVWCRAWISQDGMMESNLSEQSKAALEQFQEQDGDLVFINPGEDIPEIVGICEQVNEFRQACRDRRRPRWRGRSR